MTPHTSLYQSAKEEILELVLWGMAYLTVAMIALIFEVVLP